MRKHTGMRPHDIPVLIKVFIIQEKPWLIKDLATHLHISQSEVSESLHRSMYAGLIDEQKQKIQAQSFYEFIIYGLPYVFPQKPGPLARGIPTAHSHPALQNKFVSDTKYIWPHPDGRDVGFAIKPFYPKQIIAVRQDDQLYLMLSLIEVIRVGKAREVKYARAQLMKLFRIEK
jgi:hypothetical protein